MLCGGIGCDRESAWATLSLGSSEWNFPESRGVVAALNNCHGHKMVSYKGSAYIYGGNHRESILNELSKVNMSTNESHLLDSSR